MIFLMTKDSFLLQGFWQLKDNHEMIKINSLSEIKKVGNKPFKVIIDTYHNHILDEEAIKFLEKLDAERIIVLAPYHISKLKAKAPIYFVSRKESIKNLLEITYGKHLPHKNSQLCFSHNQFKIMQLILKNKNGARITAVLRFFMHFYAFLCSSSNPLRMVSSTFAGISASSARERPAVWTGGWTIMSIFLPFFMYSWSS